MFFVLALGSSWAIWRFAVQASQEEGREGEAFLYNFVGLLGPALIAFLMNMFSGKSMRKDYFSRLFGLRRINFLFVLITFAIPPLIVYGSTWLSLQFGQSADQYKFAADPSQLIPLIIIALILAPTIEELGWRGYGMDSLRAKMSPLGASLMFGVLWSLWHAPLVLIHGTYHYELAHMDTPIYLINFFVSVVAAAVFVNWIYYKHHRSIFGVMLAHAVLNWWLISLQTTQFTKCIITGAYIGVAILIVLFDRKAFSGGPRNFVEDPE